MLLKVDNYTESTKSKISTVFSLELLESMTYRDGFDGIVLTFIGGGETVIFINNDGIDWGSSWEKINEQMKDRCDILINKIQKEWDKISVKIKEIV